MRCFCKLLICLLDAKSSDKHIGVEQLVTADGTFAVVDAMRALSDDVELQELGFGILCCVACSDLGRNSISKAEGLAVARGASKLIPAILEKAGALCEGHESGIAFLQELRSES